MIKRTVPDSRKAALLVFAITASNLLLGCADAPAPQDAGIAVAATPVTAVQAAIQGQLGFPVTLDVGLEKRHEQWAFLVGQPRDGRGKNVDYSRTEYALAFEQGEFEDQFTALSRQLPDGSGWAVVELSIGNTDAQFLNWFEDRNLPLQLATK